MKLTKKKVIEILDAELNSVYQKENQVNNFVKFAGIISGLNRAKKAIDIYRPPTPKKGKKK